MGLFLFQPQSDGDLVTTWEMSSILEQKMGDSP